MNVVFVPPLLFALGVTLFSSVLAESPATSVAPKKHRAVTPESKTEEWWVKRHAQNIENVKKGNVDLLMIGDSITHLWENTEGTIFHRYPHGAEVWKKFYGSRRALNLGFAGDRTQHVLWRLENLPLDKISPKAAVLMIGTNNITRLETTPRQTAEGVQAIVLKLRRAFPEMKILVLHVFPREEKPDAKRRARIKELNSYLPELVGKVEKVTLRDIGAKFLDQNGVISKSVMPDFLHPNAKGYEIWAKAMEPTLKELLGE